MNPIANQFNQCPVLLDARHITSIASIKAEFDASKLTEQQRAMATGIVSANSEYKPYELIKGIAIITVRGALIHNLGYSASWATGYDVIKRKIGFAMHDPDVKGVLVKFHTPGGTVYGCPDTGDLIHECGKIKPVWTLSDDMAYSAGQWLHAQGTRRLVTQSGGLGSIGVLVAHADFSKMLEDYGVEMTLIFDGQHKVDGNPYEKLPDTVKAQIKADCKKTRGEFATAVSRGTGLSVADVLNTEAECYSGQQAVDIGLADAVVSSNSILSEFIEFVNKPQNAQTGNVMSTQPNETATTTKPAPNADTQKPDANADTQTSPATLERTRIKGIMSCEDAQGRTGLASKLAYDTSMSVDEAVAILQSSPKEPQADTPKPEENAGATVSDGFQKAMNTENHPDLSADSDQTDAELSTDEAQAAAMLASFKTATGV